MNTIKFCLKCGHPIQPDEKFCSGCGANIAQMEAEQSAAETAAVQPVQPIPQEVQPAAPVEPIAQETQPAAPVQPIPQEAQPVAPVQPIPQEAQPAAPVQPIPQEAQPAAPIQPQAPIYNAAPNQIPQGAVNAYGMAQPVPQSAPATNKFISTIKAKPFLLVIPVVAIALIIVLIIVLCNIFKYQDIDAQKLYKIEFNGINTAGACEADLNKYESYVYSSLSYSSVLSDYAAEWGITTAATADNPGNDSAMSESVSPYFTVYEANLRAAFNKAGSYEDAMKMRDALLDSQANLKINIDKTSALSNGDKVKCVVTYNEKFLTENNIKLSNTTFEVEVTGLKEGEQIDLFNNIKVSFTGNDGEGTATVDTSSAYDFIYYNWDYTSTLTNGGTFTVTAEVPSYLRNKVNETGDAIWFEYDDKYYTADNYILTKDFTVDGLTPLTEIDPFENIKFTYENASPYLSIVVDKSECSSQVKEYVSFRVDDTDLSIGDTFTIKAAAYGLSDYGYKLKGTPDEEGYYTKEYTVDADAPCYANAENVSQIISAKTPNAEAQISKIISESKDSYYFNGFDFNGRVSEFSAFKPGQTYLISNTAETFSNIGWSEYINGIATLYTSSFKTTENDTVNFTMIIMYKNAYLDNGKVESVEDPEIKYYETTTDAETYIKGLATDYNVDPVSGKPAETTPAETTKPDESSAPSEETTPETTASTAA